MPSIHRRGLRTIQLILAAVEVGRVPSLSDLTQAKAAVDHALRVGNRARSLSRGRRETKAATHRVSTSEIRAAVMARADGICECCGQPGIIALEMDHFWGRGAGREEQSVENCWALLPWHHRQKTDNDPDRGHWLLMFAAHARRQGYVQQLRLLARYMPIAGVEATP